MTLADAGVVLKLVEASKCQRQGATYTELVRSCYDCRCLPGSGGVVGTAATELTSDVLDITSGEGLPNIGRWGCE